MRQCYKYIISTQIPEKEWNTLLRSGNHTPYLQNILLNIKLKNINIEKKQHAFLIL